MLQCWSVRKQCARKSSRKKRPHYRLVTLIVNVRQYFVDSGTATAQQNGKIVGRVLEGDFFGELAFISTFCTMLDDGAQGGDYNQLVEMLGLAGRETLAMVRTASVIAKTACRCLELTLRDFVWAFKCDMQGMAATLW